LAGIGGGIYVTLKGNRLPGIVIVVGTLGTMVTTYIKQHNQRRQEMNQKRK
jgi:hypothetical protein